MENTHFSEDQENMAASARRIHTFSRKTNKANNGSEYSLLEAPRFSKLHGSVSEPETVSTSTHKDSSSTSGRERLKRHREEVAGQVSIPDKWGQEELLKDWIGCSSFEALLVPSKIASARKALVAADRDERHGRRAAAAAHRLRVESGLLAS